MKDEYLVYLKAGHIRYNPIRTGLYVIPEQYHYSSPKLYINGNVSFGMLTHFSGN